MTDLYTWNPMPHVVSVNCAECEGGAQFEFAEGVKIKLKSDVDFFKKSADFDYDFCQSTSGERIHIAWFHHGLNGLSTDSIKKLPKGYDRSDWNHSQYLYRSMGNIRAGKNEDLGTIICSHCSLRRRHNLDWPKEAYYQIGYKNKVLWAFNKECLIALIKFVNSEHRSTKVNWGGFLLKIPKHFLVRSARDEVVKRLKKALEKQGH